MDEFFQDPRLGVDESKAARPWWGCLMGSKSDAEVMDAAVKELEERRIAYEVRAILAHRDPEAVREYALAAEGRGLKVIIAGAGKAAALPGWWPR